jgi:hypothetical protein
MNEIDLSKDEIRRIANFLGYGNSSATLWFIGIEEGLGNMNDVDACLNLKARGSFESVMDLHKAHLLLRENGQFINIEQNPPKGSKSGQNTRVWQWMSKIARAYEGNDDWIDVTLAKNHIGCCLGRSNRDTFLTELSPIPERDGNNRCWISQLEKRDPKFHDYIMQRRDELKESIRKHSKSKIICYGRGGDNADKFAKLLDIKWQMRSACSDISIAGGARFLLLPFFGNGQISHEICNKLVTSGLLSKI